MFTTTSLKALSYDPAGPRRQFHYAKDPRLPGFGVEVHPTGTISFFITYRLPGDIPKRFAIGKFGPLTLAEARELAHRAYVKVKEGIDPAEERKRAKRERIEAKAWPTVREFTPKYLENARTRGNAPRKGRRARTPKKTVDQDERWIERFVVPVIGHKRLTEVTESDVRRVLNRVPGEIQPNRVRMVMSAMMEAARMLGDLPKNHPNPVKEIVRNPEPARDRSLSDDELVRLFRALETLENEHTRALLTLLILTGMRKGELRTATWDMVSLERAEIRLPVTKNGRPRVVALSTEAVSILRELPRTTGMYVFPSRIRPGEPQSVAAIGSAWERVRTLAQIPDVRIHDLRHVHATMLAEAGASQAKVARALGNTIEVSARYVNLADHAPRAEIERTGQRVADIRRQARGE